MASPENQPLPKYPRVGSSPTTPTVANLLYFGLRFIWEEVNLKELCNHIPVNQLEELTSSTVMAKAIRDDLQTIRRGGFPNISSSGSGFRRLDETNIWLYQHVDHATCSSITFEHFDKALNPSQTRVDTSMCSKRHTSHFKLEPFFHDNVSLKLMYTALITGEGHLSEQEKPAVQDLLRQLNSVLENSSTELPEMFSTGGAPCDVSGNLFDEDTWTMRLTGCLKSFLPAKFDVKTTCKSALRFKMHQMSYTGVPVSLCKCYPFHGAPDITIKNNSLIVIGNVAEAEPESGSEVETVIENTKQASRLTECPPKLGELLANMHIALVKKVIRVFVWGKIRDEMKFATRGLLLDKAAGGIVCQMSVDLKEEPVLKICVDNFVCGALSTLSLCYKLQQLLKCDNIHKQ